MKISKAGKSVHPFSPGFWLMAVALAMVLGLCGGVAQAQDGFNSVVGK